MNKISKRNKAKATAILASIVWGATVLTGCPGPVTPEIEQPTYPESVADSEMNALKENTIANVRANLGAIYNILSAHKNEEGV
nr:hypothetical protein [bacterium]